jgi:predicted porin
MEVGSGSQQVMDTFLIRGPCLTLEKLAMKKSLIALAVLTASGISFAQSSVTLFGGADLNYRSVTSGDNKFSGMAQDGIYSSRFGVMGVEDLGGGLKAGFHFEGGMNPDVGTSAKFDFQRKSTVSVMGSFGEVRLGRDYTPLFSITGIADPFGTNGVGSSYNLMNALTYGASSADAKLAASQTTFATAQAASSAAASKVADGIVESDPNAVRANNTIAFHSPAFNGFKLAAMYSFGGENTNTAKNVGTMTGLSLRYDNGPLTAAVANQVTKGGAPAIASAAASCKTVDAVVGGTCTAVNAAVSAQAATDDQKWTSNYIVGAYNFGVAKLSAGYKTDKQSFGAAVGGTLKSNIVAVTAPMGALTLKASYITRKYEAEKVGNQVAIGGVYDLSKRTSLYGTYSVLSNEVGYGMSVGSAAASGFTGVDSKGFEFGVKHSF